MSKSKLVPFGVPNVSKRPVGTPSSSGKHVVQREQPGNYYGCTPSWSFRRFDFEHIRWGLPDGNDLHQLLIRLKAYEAQTWKDILQDTAGRRENTKNHLIPVDKLIKEAQNDLIRNHLDEFESVCSLTITGRKRLFGILHDSGLFQILWYDPLHAICPSSKD